MTWDDMRFWDTGEFQVMEEMLEKHDKDPVLNYVPQRHLIFAALDGVPLEKVKVAIIGQDPYPDPECATGIAFDIGDHPIFPKSLKNIFQEYVDDLHYPIPASGDLLPWVNQGVLLWNTYPTCGEGRPGSHRFPEWEVLSEEIVESLDKQKVVFVFLGTIAHKFAKFVKNNPVLCFAHPANRKNAFAGCRMFSTINTHLNKLELEPIEWRL